MYDMIFFKLLNTTNHKDAAEVEHSNSRFESIRFYSLCESIRIDSFSKKNRPFDSLVVMQFFLVYLFIVSAKK